MTDLTEKWKNGELEIGWYYVNFYSVGAVMQEYIPEHNGFGYDEKNLIQEVLAPVPTYQEYLESEARCAVYSDENKRLKEDVERYASECAKLRKQGAGTREQLEYKKVENQRLKELLKKTRDILYDYKDYFQSGDVVKAMDILDGINAAISESEE